MMLCRIFRFFAVVTIVFTPMLVRADDIPAIAITDKTNPKIAELYQKLQDKNAEIAGIESERLGALEENATAMYEKEQSLENKTLTATTTAATGLGAMGAASAYAERLADADAEEEMSAYITTMRCEYGNGKQVNLGNEETLPGGNELSKYYAEYKQLAEKLKATKKALNLRPGIESEILYDRAESGIYQYQNAEQQSGAYTSLSRALMNPEGEDATKIAAQKQENSEKLKAGLIAAGAGIVAGVIGNYEINKDAPKESSTEINREYDDKVSKVNKEKTDIEAELTNVIEENRRRVQEYNQMVEQLRNSRDEIERAPTDCRKLFGDYIASVSDLELIENETDVVPDVAIPEMDSDLLAQCVQCKNKGADFNSVTKECKCPADKPVEKGGQCVEKPTEVIPVVEEQPRVEIPVSESQEIEKETPKADYCPKTGNALKSINDTHKVGDNCTSDIISQGTITKRQNGTCTCNATGCWTPYTPKGGKCVKVEGTSTDAGGSDKTGDAYIDENGFCKPYKIKEWFFNKESSADISKKFQKLCDEAAKAHNCKRKDLNTSRLIEKDDSGAVQYEWTCNADSEDYLATQERINQRHANLSYENVCKKLKPGTTNQEGQIKRGCFGIFEDIDIPDYKTQLELAKARIGTSSACSEKREVRRSTASNNPVGYYTNCNTTNDKERYTFIFTGVGNDNTTPENFMRAACATYGVKFGAQGGELGRKQPYCSYAYKSIDNDPTCNKINALSQKFGYTARIVRGTGCVLDTTGTVGGDQLAKSGMRSDEKITTLRTAFGIDNNMFANISTNMDEWLYDQMRINIANEMKRAGHSDPLVKFECFPAKSFALDKGVEFKLFGNTSGRNVLTCQANGHDIDFVFAQLGRSTKRRANASQEGLTCIFGSNGKYDGRQCWGVTEDDCKKLDAAIKENAKTCPQCGAKWDGGIGGCTLTKSTKVEKTNKGLEIAGNIALIAGGAVLTVMSGGMAMPMLVTELALMGVEITGATVAAVEEKHMRNVANEFLAKTQYCHDAECAQQLLNDTEVHRILNLESNLDEKQSKVIDDKLAELLRVIPADAPLYVALVNETENKQNCNFWRNATAQCEWAQFVHAWANVAQFASLGVALGRSAVRFINARKAIIEVAEQTTKKMTRAQAKRIGEIDKEINKIESITPGRRTAKQTEDLKKLRQERNTILNKVGTKDADEVARLQQAALNEQAIKDAQKEYQVALKKRNEMADYMAKHNGNPPQGKTRFDVKDINDEVAKAEKKLKDLGQEVTPAEPLQIGKKPTVASAETKPADNTAKTKDTKPAESSANPKEPGIEPATPQSRVYEKLGDKTKADIADIKSGKYKELYIPKGQLTDEEWKILKEDLVKDDLGITEDPSYFIIKKTNNVDDVAKVSSKADDAADAGRSTTKNADDVLDESGKKPKENDVKTGADGIETINPTAQKLKELGFTEYNDGVFVAKNRIDKDALNALQNVSYTTLRTEDGSDIFIAVHGDTDKKFREMFGEMSFWYKDFTRVITQNKNNIQKLNQIIRNRTPITKIKGHNVYITQFGRAAERGVVKVEVAGRELPFYVSTGSAGKTRVATGKWEFFGGVDDGWEWFNKGNLDEIRAHYDSPELEQIAIALDNVVGDIRDKELILQSYGRSYLNGSGKVAVVSGDVPIAGFDINKGLKYAPSNNNNNPTNFYRNLEDVKDWFKKITPANEADNIATGASASGAKGTTSKSVNGATKSNAGAASAKINTAFNEFDDMLSHSNTLKNLNSQGRLQWTTSSSLNGKQYVRIKMGENPDMNEAQQIIQNLRKEGFYVSSNTAQGGEKFLGVSRENIFTPWNKSSNNWAFNHVDDVVEITPEIFDARNLRVSDGSGQLYVRNSAKEMLGFPVSADDAVSEVDQLYSIIRRGIDYPVNDAKVYKAINAMEHPSSLGIVYREPTSSYRWHMNGYQGAFSKHAEYHVSLNVDVDDNLIKKLNEIVSKDKGQHIVYYKIPTAGSLNWKTMADPITIYLSKTSPEIERAIASVAKPYVRTSSEIGLLGRKIDDGVAIAYETSDLRTDIVQDIINQIARKDATVAKQLAGRHSTGSTEALRVWASDFLGYTIAPVIP